MASVFPVCFIILILEQNYSFLEYLYHVASKALVIGIGNASSNAVCTYSTDAKVNSVCPTPCQSMFVVPPLGLILSFVVHSVGGLLL
jgi:hypothetical protein